MKLEFSRQIFEKTQISSFIKIRPVEAELFDADGETDMTKQLASFRNFANAHKSIATKETDTKNIVLGVCFMFWRFWMSNTGTDTDSGSSLKA